MSDLFTVSAITGQANPDTGPVREWFVRLDELQPGEHSFGQRIEIGHARLFTVPELDLEHISDGLKTVVAALAEATGPQLQGPVLILDQLYVKPEYRGRGLAHQVAEAAFSWFEGLVNLEALAVTRRQKFRPAACRIVEKLGFQRLTDDVWVRKARPTTRSVFCSQSNQATLETL